MPDPVPAATTKSQWSGQNWLKEPLLHFLLAGGLLFVVVGAWQGQSSEGRSIRIEGTDLLHLLQGRAPASDDESLAALLDTLSLEERAALIRDAAVQEALYREGIALGLAEADPLIRQRVVQQMRLLLMEEAAADMQVSDAEMRAYFEDHKADYALPSAATFTHVFVTPEQGQQHASELLAQLRRDRVRFDSAGQFGDRFLYQLNYTDVGPALVSSHFGEEFSDRLFGMPEDVWQGPVLSDHGWHLVLVDSQSEARTPALEDVADIVREDALAAKRQAAAALALDGLLDRYEIVAAGTE